MTTPIHAVDILKNEIKHLEAVLEQRQQERAHYQEKIDAVDAIIRSRTEWLDQAKHALLILERG